MCGFPVNRRPWSVVLTDKPSRLGRQCIFLDLLGKLNEGVLSESLADERMYLDKVFSSTYNCEFVTCNTSQNLTVS